MPLFRFQRGGLDESIATTVIVKTPLDLFAVISQSAPDGCPWKAAIEIEPYPSEGKNFDPRTGWYTHIVLANIVEPDKMHPVGFLSEPLE